MGWTISCTTARDTDFPEGLRYVILRFVRATVAAVKAETEIEREITQDGDIAAIEKKLRQWISEPSPLIPPLDKDAAIARIFEGHPGQFHSH